MAFELLTETPDLLKERYLVQFSIGWPDETHKSGQLFRVERTIQVKYDVGRIIAAGETQDLDFAVTTGGIGDNNLALIPQNPLTMYELLIGFKGNPLVYPRYANEYYLKLEATGVLPDTGNARRRYLGFYDRRDSPFTAPRLREHTVRYMETPVFRVHNDGDLAEKVVFRFIVNRCLLAPATNVTQEERQRARLIKHYTLNVW